MYIISQRRLRRACTHAQSESLQYIVVCIQNKYGFYRITRHGAHIGLKKNRVQLNNKKNPVFVQVIVLFAGIKYIAFGKQAVKALARLCVCANSTEPSL